MIDGWFKVHRDVFKHRVLRSARFSKLEAWLWMVGAAAYADHELDLGGRLVTIRRGQFSHSVRFLGEAWGWGKSSVSRFLARLKTESMIGTESGTGGETGQILVTICNYDKYQADGLTAVMQDGTGNGTHSGTAAGQQRDKEEEGKEGKERREDLSDPQTPKNGHGGAHQRATEMRRFGEFWDTAYPHRGGRKKGRATAEAKYRAAVSRGIAEATIISGALAARQDPDVLRGYARDPTTWLNQEGWADEITPPNEERRMGAQVDVW